METFFVEKNKEKKTKFKSYYVVWKQSRRHKSTDFLRRLNRTM